MPCAVDLDVDHDPVVIIDGMTKNMRVSNNDDSLKSSLLVEREGGGTNYRFLI
jgi:hypothetical protein